MQLKITEHLKSAFDLRNQVNIARLISLWFETQQTQTET